MTDVTIENELTATEADAISPLDALLQQEQRKLAGNVYRLAQYYTPFGKLPDEIDFKGMTCHASMMADGTLRFEQLWPEAKDRLRQLVSDSLAYYKLQKTAIDGLLEAGAKHPLPDDALFKHAQSQDRTYQKMVAQTSAMN